MVIMEMEVYKKDTCSGLRERAVHSRWNGLPNFKKFKKVRPLTQHQNCLNAVLLFLRE